MQNLFINFRKTCEITDIDYNFKGGLRRAILAALKHEGINFDVEVSLTLCDNEYIHALNLAHRDVDRHTDVLSFPMYEREEIDMINESGADIELMIGDIVVSHEQARVQAEELGNSFFREVSFLVIHSVLHLLGYDHERSAEDDELQCAAQREIIETLEI